MQAIEVLAGLGLLFGALVAAKRHAHDRRHAMARLLGIALLATAGAVLLTMPIRQHIQELQGTLQVRR
jgi:hypothetical protein